MLTPESQQLAQSLRALFDEENYVEIHKRCDPIIEDTPRAEKEFRMHDSHENIRDLEHRILAMFYKNYALQHDGKAEVALEGFEEALKLANTLEKTILIADICIEIAEIYYDSGTYEKTLEYYRTARPIYRKLGLNAPVCRILDRTGNIYLSFLNYRDALRFYEEASSIAADVDLLEDLLKQETNIGRMFHHLDKYERSLEHFEKAEKLAKKLDDQTYLALIFDGTRATHAGRQKFFQAANYSERSIEIVQELGNKEMEAEFLEKRSVLELERENFRLANKFGIESVEVAREAGIPKRLGLSLKHFAVVTQTEGNPQRDIDKSLELLHESVKLLEDIYLPVPKQEAYEMIIDLYAEKREFENAFTLGKTEEKMRADVLQEEIDRTVKEESVKFLERQSVILGELNNKITAQRRRSNELLLNILPKPISVRLTDGEDPIADDFQNASIFFSDIKGFTALSSLLTAEDLVDGLNGIVYEMDRLTLVYGLEKVKTIGDAYMAVSGLPIRDKNHAENVIQFALKMQEYMQTYKMRVRKEDLNEVTIPLIEGLAIRMGIHTGRVVAGVIGDDKFTYDLWGDAVNTAARMESNGEAGKIHVSEDYKNALSSKYIFTKREPMVIKGKGLMQTYFVEGEK